MGLSLTLHNRDNQLAVVTRDVNVTDGAWGAVISLLSPHLQSERDNQVLVQVTGLLASLTGIAGIARRFRVPVAVTGPLEDLVKRIVDDTKVRTAAQSGELPIPDPEAIKSELARTRFTGDLRHFQLENLGRLVALPHGANFSVPGAGKTMVSLALYEILRARGLVEQLLVVAPLSAFEAWKQEALERFSPPLKVCAYLQGAVPSCEVLLVNYHRLAGQYDALMHWVGQGKSHVILDEAHRVKRGRDGVHGNAALDLALYAARRDILTGTPAPQGPSDLLALFEFLWPGQGNLVLSNTVEPNASASGVEATRDRISGLFVRTTKRQLDLPATRFQVEKIPMGPIQSAIYSALKGQLRGTFTLNASDKGRLRELGRASMYLIEAAVNPALLLSGSSDEDMPPFRHPPLPVDPHSDLGALLQSYSDHETPAKLARAVQIVGQITARDKVLLWTTFRRNFTTLERLLSGLQPAVVHGGIPPEDGAPPGAVRTRESEIRRFREDDRCRVLIANPAACAEGVSLHKACHHAVFLDRTFNAGQFLQAQDRIHRLGLTPGQLTTFIVLQSAGTIDESIDSRLRSKVETLGALLDDPGLATLSLPNEEDVVDVLDDLDIAAIMEHLYGA